MDVDVLCAYVIASKFHKSSHIRMKYHKICFKPKVQVIYHASTNNDQILVSLSLLPYNLFSHIIFHKVSYKHVHAMFI